MITKAFLKRTVVYTILISLLFSIPNDPDLGWHYKYGEYFWTHGKLLTQNIFSFTNVDYPWLNTYWLYEITLFPLYKNFGLILPSLAATIITSLFLYKKILKKAELFETKVIISILFTSMLTFYSVTVRPHFLSSILMLVLINWLLNEKNNIKWAPLLFLFWANWHADFVLGLFIYGIAVASKTIQCMLSPIKQKNPGKVAKAIGIFIISLASTLINPYGINLWITLANELTLPAKSYVHEWTNPMVFKDFSTILFFVVAGLISCLASYINRKRYPFWYFPLSIFFFLFSLKAVYMGRILALLGIFPLIDLTDTLAFNYFEHINGENKLKEKVILSKAVKYIVLVVLISCMGVLIYKIESSASIKNVANTAKAPYNAVNFIRDNKLKGNMLNDYNWGGYLIWQLPEYKTYIDGRMTSWNKNGEYFTKKYLEIKGYPEKHADYLESQINTYDINFALLPHKSSLAGYLEYTKNWKVAYRDNTAVVLIRSTD